MTYAKFEYDFSALNISGGVVEKILGFKEEADHDMITLLIDEIMRESADFQNIRAEYRIYSAIKFLNTDNSLEINNIKFLVNKILTGQLRKSGSVAVFLCTAGGETGSRSRKAMNEGDPLKAYIYDIFGSVMVDAAADLMQAELERSVEQEGKKITNRYSPGYCGWDVAEQHKLFQLMPDNSCGIKLTPSALMDPVKSISGIIGIGTGVKYNPYTCGLCEQKDCTFREVQGKD
jgi:Vitamin B12 dependent methionine synthase, activation domain